jgi:hypothetical protein
MFEFIEEYWWAIAGTLIGSLVLARLLHAFQLSENRQKFRRYIFFVVILAGIGGTVAFTMGISSDAYDIARTYARVGPETASQFGVVKDVSMRSFHLQSDEARYSFVVEGEKGKGMLTLFLKKDPAWRVVRVESP